MIRRLCWFSAAFSLAVFLAVYLLPETLLFPAGALCLLGLAFSFLTRGKRRLRVAFACVGLAAGLVWTGCYGLLFRTPAHALVSEDAQPLRFVIAEFPRDTSWGASLTVRLSGEGAFSPKAQLYADEDARTLRPGDVVTAQVKLSRSDFRYGTTNDYYESLGIYLIGNVRGEVTLESRPEHIPARYWPQWTAKTLKGSISSVFPPDVSGYFTALITGDKSFLPVGLYAAFQRSGIAHVVAVSGLHISFLAGAIALLLGKRNRLSAAVSMILIFFFAIATGGSPSALRAAFMTSAILIAPLVGRENDNATTLATVLGGLLLVCPYAAASVSLQLSFAAVAGIFLITGPLASKWLQAIPRWDGRLMGLVRKILVFLATTLAVTLGALLFTTPLTAIHFGSVCLVGPFTNLLTLWAVSLAFIGGILVALVGLASLPVGSALGWLVAWPARWVIWVATGISRLPFASVALLSGYLVAWFVFAYAILLLWFIYQRAIRPAVPVGMLVLTLCAALALHIYPAASSDLTVVILDVGQGASTLLYSDGQTVLVDCGGSGLDDAGDVAADYIQSLGSSHLDALVLTHYHADHANGVPELLARLEVDRIILPDVTPAEPLRQEILALAEAHGCDVELIYYDDAQYTLGNAQLNIYIPLGDGGANEAGLSVLCSSGDFDVLLTGDMNSIVERRLVKYKNLPDIELLVVGHHGSKNSTSEELLLATRPEMAVISVGYNSYGHPTDQVLERLSAAGCEIYRTDWMGNITFTIPKTLK